MPNGKKFSLKILTNVNIVKSHNCTLIILKTNAKYIDY